MARLFIKSDIGIPMPTRSAIVQCRQLTHCYASTPALSEVDFELAAGQVTALLGPNGAGKTTLIHLLLGLLPCRNGRIRMFGKLPPGHRQARARIGVMLQQSGVQQNLTVRELIELFASFYPAPSGTATVLDECGLTGLEARRFDRLSGGQRQRVLYALAIVGNPDLLVLDEPTTGLDPAARRRLWTAIEARRASGAAILLSTHFMEEAERLADRVCVLDRGEVRALGTPDEIRRRVPRDTIRARTTLTAERLRALPEVEHVRIDETGVELLSISATQTLRALLAADPDIDGLEVRAADLETAFLALTETDRQEAA
ncbi:MAG: multidrug ABC transporter ATP-binding protein [Gammaproteobacteria bacterium HGW-Gammaproteobacteria-8]|nr:MAG: multidrug ABC transporter ATP-binding protein [Gammaproteobacteria bacterium HGW-Gammaproteobacteria-8]